MVRRQLNELNLKRFAKLFFFIIFLSAGLFAILNLPVTSRQGVNYVVKTTRMPLYIKIIEFLDRDYHYKKLAKRICQGCRSNEEKVLGLFEWTYQNIKRDIPESWPIIDDHVWNIIVRGYGARDQFSDVFTTLCNYAGVDAFYSWVYTQDQKQRIPLSFVEIDSKWVVFDPYHGVYFKVKNDKLVDVEAIRSGSGWTIEALDEKPTIDYAIYLNNLSPVKEMGLKRANIQSPLNRLLFEIKKRTR